MLNKLSFQPTNLFVLLFFLVLATFGSTVVAQASGANHQKDCTVAVQTGWRPYRASASDTLSVLATQANVTVETLMTANCLKSDQISAGDLVLVPTQAVAAAVVSDAPVATAIVEATVVEAAAPQPRLEIISTTTSAALAAVALPQENAAQPVASMVASPFSTANVVVVAILLLGIMVMIFFGLRPRADDSPLVQSVFSLLGNGIFLFAGVLIGVILFPLVNTASFTRLPTAVSATIAVTLIAILVAKELFFNGHQWRTVNRLLNLGITPLLMVFFLTIASRLAGGMN